MMLQNKYRELLNLGEKMEVKDGYVNEEGGKLKIGGTVKCQYEKDVMWDTIKRIGGESPMDIEANIDVEQTDWYATYTVQKGDTLGKISKLYLDKAGRYMDIFNLNTDILKDPNLIHVGQVLKIPFK